MERLPRYCETLEPETFYGAQMPDRGDSTTGAKLDAHPGERECYLVVLSSPDVLGSISIDIVIRCDFDNVHCALGYSVEWIQGHPQAYCAARRKCICPSLISYNWTRTRHAGEQDFGFAI
ncbi:uncharacterized protein RCC_03210 [Ramularia collo-cygni]|uniref:Uncharacterized protein n=1 Tax=Ramularia collo-cygni TaxID=112498 RepID=A0A2D3V1I1_9PEZI|nr:uncharacterized protein RCC_03210 [Ramularia collo-cygni]CZT17376.1 uncharacterized protein RCC_03210 [Ramularia collo-cygni]